MLLSISWAMSGFRGASASAVHAGLLGSAGPHCITGLAVRRTHRFGPGLRSWRFAIDAMATSGFIFSFAVKDWSSMRSAPIGFTAKKAYRFAVANVNDCLSGIECPLKLRCVLFSAGPWTLSPMRFGTIVGSEY